MLKTNLSSAESQHNAGARRNLMTSHILSKIKVLKTKAALVKYRFLNH